MLIKNEIKVLQVLLEGLSTEHTISGISRALKQKYFQTYRTVRGLGDKGLVRIRVIGKSNVVELDFAQYHPEYTLAEIERCSQACKSKKISIISDNILNIDRQFVCVLFGSCAVGKVKPDSDIDLLFVIPEDYDYAKFERLVKKQLWRYDCDVNITTEKGLLGMWANPQKLNVGNELLKGHVVLYGSERFINLLGRYHVG